jgi:hypothetical protein
MGDENLQDQARRALGLRTAAEQAAESVADTRRMEALEADRPRRGALRQKFSESVDRWVDHLLGELDGVVKEAGFYFLPKMVIPTRERGDPAEVLTLMQCQLRRMPNPRSPLIQTDARLPPLEFRLQANEKVTIDIFRGMSTPRMHPIVFSVRTVSLPEASREMVQSAFLDYLSACHAAQR